MVEAGQDWKDVAIPGAALTAAPAAAAVAAAAAPAVATAAHEEEHHAFTHPAMVGPATALLLSQYNIQPASIAGSGPKGNILKSDVLRHIETNGLKPVSVVKKVATPPPPSPPVKETSRAAPAAAPPRPRSGYVDIELTNMRKVIAKRLSDSKQAAPHGYSSATACIDAVSRLRQDYIRSGHKVSINDFVIKAVATALQYVPDLNVNIVDEAPAPQSRIDISVAVATEAGLITPIVKDAASKTVQQIAGEVKELAGRARLGKLKLDEFQAGGCCGFDAQFLRPRSGFRSCVLRKDRIRFPT
jgi:pyruvate/2-oxoglutarate dehydrogenase complex dihydrolipoamide acyltransferase (E2) component